MANGLSPVMAILTQQQKDSLRADIQADPVLGVLSNSADSIYKIIDAYKQPSVTGFIVWSTNVLVQNIYDAINWALFTPSDVPPVSATPANPTQGDTYNLLLWQSRAEQCESKQSNVIAMLSGRDYISGAKQNIRSGLQDGLTNILSGVGGASQNAGWNNVKASLTRIANRLERLFVTGVGTAASPGNSIVEGELDFETVRTAMGW